jgi:hypothetical protein
MSSSSVESNVQKAVNESKDFANVKESRSFDSQIAAGTEASAQSAINQADAMRNMLQMQRDETNQKVLNPPMKEVAAGGKSSAMKQVVDTQELAKLETQLKNLDGQLANAKAKVEVSKDEALRATVAKIELTAEKENAASKEKDSLSLAESFRTMVAKKETVTYEDLQVFAKENDIEVDIVAGAQTTNQGNQTNQNTQNTANNKDKDSDKKVNEASTSTGANTD